jgi:hypothetical protein
MRRLTKTLAAASVFCLSRAAAAQPAAAAPGPYQGPGAVQVHLDSHGYEFPPSLAQAVETSNGTGWKRLCKAPCDRPIDPSAVYRIEGGHSFRDASSTDDNGNTTTSVVKEKFTPSEPFRVFPSPASQTLWVDGSSRFWSSCRYWCTPSAIGFGVLAGLAFGGVFEQDRLGRKVLYYAVGIPSSVCFALFGAAAVYGFVARTKVYDDSGHRLARGRVTLTPTGVSF